MPTAFRILDAILHWWNGSLGWYIMHTLIRKAERIFIVATQHSNIAIIWQLYIPSALCFAVPLAWVPAFAASLTFSQHHVAVISLWVWATYGCLHGKTPYKQQQKTQNTNIKTKPEPPKTPSPVLHSQDKAHATELLRHPETCFAWHFVLSSDSFITGRKTNIWICSPCHFSCGAVKSIKVASELTQM